jgi:hypothetical protein
MILGTIFDLNFPFVFDTLKVKPNKERFIEVHKQDYDFLDGRRDVVEDDAGDNVVNDGTGDNVVDNLNSYVIVRTDFEQYIFDEYLSKTGFETNVTVQSKIYEYSTDAEPNQSVLSIPYPKNVVQMFTSCHGIGPRNKRKFDTTELEKKFETVKRNKIGN